MNASPFGSSRAGRGKTQESLALALDRSPNSPLSRLERLERADAEERRCYIRINQSELAFGKMHSILKEEGGDGECGMEGTCVAHKWRPRPRMFLAYSFASLSPVAPSSPILTLAHRNQQRRRYSECWMELGRRRRREFTHCRARR